MAQLVIHAGDGTTFNRELTQEPTTLSSDPGSTILLPAHAAGSRAEITFSDGIYRLRDLGASGGTILNGQPVTQAALRDGDILRVGAVKCVFQAAAPDDLASALTLVPPPASTRPPVPPPLPVPPPIPTYSTPPPIPSMPPVPTTAAPSPAPVPPPIPSMPPVPTTRATPPPIPPVPSYPSPSTSPYPAPPAVPPAPSHYTPPTPPPPVTAALPPMPLPDLPSIAPLPAEAVAAAARVTPTTYFGKIAQLFRAAFREARRRTQLASVQSRINTARQSELPKAHFHVGQVIYHQSPAPEALAGPCRDIAELERQLIACRQEIVAHAQTGHPQAQAAAAALEARLRAAFASLGAAAASPANRPGLPADRFAVLDPVESAIALLERQHAVLAADATSREELAALTQTLRHETGVHLQNFGHTVVTIATGEDDDTAAADAGPPLPERVELPDRLVLGRDPRCGLVLANRDISQTHLEIVREGGGFVVRDLFSTSGTFVNGQRIAAPVALREGDRVRAGAVTFVLQGGALLPSSEKNNTRITVTSLTKTVISLDTRQPLNLLENVNLVIEPKEFVALLGPSGSGKSTFMDAINGRRRATGGRVMVNDDDFYQSYQYYRRAIGYVPQQDIVHMSLTVRQALRYAARMRLPADTTPGEIEGIINGVIQKMGLQERAKTRISNLSGGQLKRVSLGVELISDPSLLFLDEATSGLDAGTESKMMTLFRKIADDGTTVVCITHNVENVSICNMVVVLVRGRLTYYGPPAELPGYFGVMKISEVYDALEARPPAEWAQKYEASELYQKYVVARLQAHAQRSAALPPPVPANMPPVPTNMPPVPNMPPLPPAVADNRAADVRAGRDPRQLRTNFFRQYQVLRQRYALITLQDQKNLLILLAQAPVIAVLIGLALWGKAKFSATDPKADMEQVVLFLMVVSAVWFGCSNATKEIVKELPIYKRERAINLEILTYLLSKVTVLSVLCAIQCLTLVLIIIPLTSANISVVGSFLVIYLTALASTMMGLVVSSLVDNTDKANTITPLLLIPQVVFAGCIVPLDNPVMKTLASVLIIAYWGFDGMLNLVPSGERGVHTPDGNVIGVVKSPVFSSMTVDLFFLLVMLVAFFYAAIWGLRRKDVVG